MINSNNPPTSPRSLSVSPSGKAATTTATSITATSTTSTATDIELYRVANFVLHGLQYTPRRQRWNVVVRK